MSAQRWVESIRNSQASGSAHTGSTTATSILNAADVKPVEGGFFFPGKTVRIHAAGKISTVVTTPGTLILEVMLGAVAIFSSGAMALNVVAKTDVNWILDLYLVCRAQGASTNANVWGSGLFISHSVIGAAAVGTEGAGIHPLPYNSNPQAGTGFDSTDAADLDLFADWSLNNANSITCDIFAVEELN